MLSALVQMILGFATWGPTRAGMDILMETGDTTQAGMELTEVAVNAYMNKDVVLVDDSKTVVV